MLELKWKLIVVWCFATAAIEWLFQGLSKALSLNTRRRIIICGATVAYLTIRIITGNLDFWMLLESIAINLLASLLLSE
jgi:hypothetical protein